MPSGGKRDHGEQFTFLDLFAGVGGFHHALQGLGGTCVLAVEKDELCQKVYRSAFPSTPLVSDIRSLTQTMDGAEKSREQIRRRVPQHDLLCAGFPCQPFSKSGLQRGVRDRVRGTLFFDIVAIVEARKPKFIILENVRNLAGPRHTETWKVIISSLQDLGYQVRHEPLIISPHHLEPSKGGAPQIRERVFIMAELDDATKEAEPVWMQDLAGARSNPIYPDWSIHDYMSNDADISNLDEYKLRPDEVGWIEAWQQFVQMIPSDWLPGHPIWVEGFRVRPRIPADAPEWKIQFLRKNSQFYRKHKGPIDRWLEKRWGPLRQRVPDFPLSRQKFEWQARSIQPKRSQRDLHQLVIQFRPSGIRVKPASYLPALVAMSQTSIVGSRMRRITPREAAGLQGIPMEPFIEAGVPDSVIYEQLGNAVNVGVVKHLAKNLLTDFLCSDVSGGSIENLFALEEESHARVERFRAV
jgi:DNA (cytosine-5)-methyltransferase 1